MITNDWDTTPLIGAKLLKIRIHSDDSHMTLEFDNGRTLTGLLSIRVRETAIEPKLELICGYHNRG